MTSAERLAREVLADVYPDGNLAEVTDSRSLVLAE
jgi:hypothetical protein